MEENCLAREAYIEQVGSYFVHLKGNVPRGMECKGDGIHALLADYTSFE